MTDETTETGSAGGAGHEEEQFILTRSSAEVVRKMAEDAGRSAGLKATFTHGGSVEPNSAGTLTGLMRELNLDAEGRVDEEFASAAALHAAADIRFSGGVPVGGWSHVDLWPNGLVRSIGHLHNSGFPSYSTAVLWTVQATQTGRTFMRKHGGHCGGTLGGGSRDDDWDDSQVNAAVAAAWPELARGWRWRCDAAVGLDIGGLVEDVAGAIGVALAVVAFI
ncbi:hypothetical protein [Streptomyces atroolivaceus]|uniref:hypothetical protein n=1 Tax=Streptomyces atroolivaceus TaxID=66869 RepID=UPI003698BDF1